MATKFEITAAAAFAGATVYSIHDVYTKHAPSLQDCRQADAGDALVRQALQDADFLTGMLVGIAGGVLAVSTKRVEPLLIAAMAYGVTSLYYHRACEGDPY